MKIAVFGYYQQLNYGDDRIGQALINALYPHTIVLLPHYQAPPSMEWFDFILIGGGGLVWERVGIWCKPVQWLRNTKKPFGVVGLGINEVDDDLKSDLCWMASKAKIFAVRDKKSHQLLNYHPSVEVLPDLTWMIPFESRPKVPGVQKIACNLASKHPQGYDPMAWGKLLKDFENIEPFPLRFGKNHESDIFHILNYKNIPQEFSSRPLYECSYLIGSRFHSIIFALQIGIPFIAILYDDKVARLLDDNNLQELGIGAFEYESLETKIDYLTRNFNEINERILAVREELVSNAIELRQNLRCVVENSNVIQKSLFRELKFRLKSM